MKTLYQDFKGLGLDLDNHESDLYVKDSELSRSVMKRHNVGLTTTFLDEDGVRWIDIPFAFDPWWEKKKEKKSSNVDKIFFFICIVFAIFLAFIAFCIPTPAAQAFCLLSSAILFFYSRKCLKGKAS